MKDGFGSEIRDPSGRDPLDYFPFNGNSGSWRIKTKYSESFKDWALNGEFWLEGEGA